MHEKDDIPPLPPGLVGVKYEVAIPSEAARRIRPGQAVYRHPATGEVSCAAADQVLREWRAARRSGGTLTGYDVHLLLETLEVLAGNLPEGFIGEDGAWHTDPEETEVFRTAAAYMLGAVIARMWRTSGDERAALKKRARSADPPLSLAALKVQLAAEGLLLAFSDERTPRTMKRRQQWITDAAGHKRIVVPLEDVSARHFLDWLFRETQRNARIGLGLPAERLRPRKRKGDVQSQRGSRPKRPLEVSLDAWLLGLLGKEPESLEVRDPDPFAPNDFDGPVADSAEALAVLSPKQQEVVKTLRRLAETIGGAAEMRQAAARELGISDATMRVHLKNIRDRLRSA